MYVLKRKDLVFEKFLEWKSLVEKSTGRKLKVLHTDNGGEYTSVKFGNLPKSEGVQPELTVPKLPEQDGVAEGMNRILVETVSSVLSDAKLPQAPGRNAVHYRLPAKSQFYEASGRDDFV